MLPTRLLSTSTFRLTLLYLGIFSLSAVALLIGVYFTSVRLMDRQTMETINVEIEGLLDQYRFRGITGLAQVIAQRAAIEPDRRSIYLLTDRASGLQVGNLDALPSGRREVDEVWRFPIEVVPRETGRKEMHEAVARLLRIDGRAILLVGRDVADQARTQQLLRLAIGVGAALMVVLGLVGGYVMSRWTLNRIDEVNRTTARIMAGDLDRRIEVGGGDEFDELARNLNAMLDRIGSLLTGMRQVTDDIAHDLRTPLSRMRSRVEVALMGEPGPAESRELLEATLHDADGLIETFNALLRITQAETGALRGEYERFDLSEIAREVFDLYEPVAEDLGIALSLDAAAPVEVDGHRQLLAQAVVNVADNAIKYTPPGGRVTIATSARPAPTIGIVDTGPGIPADQRERVKQRFVRLDATRGTPGSGLGLSLVEAVAKLHEATFTLADAGPGLRVALILRAPQARDPDPAARRTSPATSFDVSSTSVNPVASEGG